MSLVASAKAAASNSILRKVFVTLTLSSMTIPSIVFPARPARANSTSRTPVPVSAPPEPYVINPSPIVADIVPTLTGAFSSAAKLFTIDQPEGLGAVKPPTFSEKIASAALALVPHFEPPFPSWAAPPTAATVSFDFDGDGKADAGRWRYSNTEFKLWNSGGGTYSTYSVGCNPSTTSGCSAARPVPGDYDGDGVTDAAVYSSGIWKYKPSPTASEVTLTNTLGQSGDVLVPADYAGDAKTDQAVFRPSNGTWYMVSSAGSTSVQFGQSGDIPTPGDYDGDGKADVAVFRPSTGYWYVQGASSVATYQWGISSDVPVAADYDGDGKTDIAVFRRTTGTWYILKSTSNFTAYDSYSWGNYGDQPAPADYDGDGKADAAVWRPTTGGWWILKSSGGYTSLVLGEQGDVAVPAAYVRQVGGTMTSDQVAAARLSPRNATGGTNLYSQNFSWGTSLVSLPGRAGLDLSFGIGYNSLVWTKVGNEIYFDTDWSNVSPGFRFGFPTVQPVYYDAAKQKYAYMMVTPSGNRDEFMQTAASNVYETADSSYAQMVVTAASNPNTPAGPNDSPDTVAIRVTTTDGTQSSYEWKNGQYHCKEIKDRNGNYITILNNDAGQMASVTDTLGRVVTVDYDTDGYPTSIKQDWKTNNGTGSTIVHNWATLSYTTATVNTDFDTSLTVLGPPNGTVLKVLDRITYADGSSTRLDYNGYAQVYKASQIAADSTSHVLNYVRTNIQSPASGQTDCPRFTETRDWAENFNQNSSGTAQERVVTNSLTPNSTYSLGDGHTGTATKIEVAMAGDPHNSVTKTFVGSSGWNEGLTVATEDWADGLSGTERKRWTWTGWTQDDTSKSYILNPRITETRVGDDNLNIKATSYSYCSDDQCTQNLPYGLVRSVTVTNPNSSSVILKKVQTEYNLDSAYTSRRIIGLPAQMEVFGKNDLTGSPEYVSKVTYGYDEGNFADSTLSQDISPTQHDPNYGVAFVQGRGNLTSTTRWNVEYPTSSTYAVTSSIKYNTAGSPVSQTDPRGRISTFSYADVWNDSVGRTTYAYPTTVTDPGGNSSTVEYRFDIGSNVWANSPTPAVTGNTYGKNTSRTYDDSTGRIAKEMVANTGAYTRYDYLLDGISLNTYTTVVDANGDNAVNGADEVLSETLFDGAGRVRKTRTENPNSTGGYAGKLLEYDMLGRLKRASVPTEMNSAWNPAGDDYRGMSGNNYIWLWDSKEFDWKGRVTRIVPSDSNGSDGKDQLISYEGCGCAGGQVTTIMGEISDAVDAAGNLQTTKRRTRKIYEDILGRTVKTEIWDLDGAGGNPYSTVVNSYSGRDQVVLSRRYAGSSASATYQDSVFAFDGHGRLAARHLPIEDVGTSTTWTYNPDDSVATVTDPRGAVASFNYGHLDDASSSEYRPLLTKISYTAPQNSTIPVPSDVSFIYDPAGNRTYMSDGSGTHSYSYDSLSRLTSETQTFAGLTGNFTINYGYQISGKLKSVTDPYGADIYYNDDRAGRTTSVTGSGFLDVTTYASNIKYRAFGGVKEMTYGSSDASHVSYTYDNRLRAASYESTSSTLSAGFVRKASYDYYSDGGIKKVNNLLDSGFDQSYKYDFADRMVSSTSGTKLNNQNEEVTPYAQGIGYDAFGNITWRGSNVWGNEDGFSATYVNGRKQGGNEVFDAAGNIVDRSTSSTVYDRWSFDAAGRGTETTMRWYQGRPGQTSFDKTETIGLVFDGDGQTVKRTDTKVTTNVTNVPPSTSTTTTTEYYIRSTVLGGKILSEVNSDGSKQKTNVYTGNGVLAEQMGSSTSGEVYWNHEDLLTGSYSKVTRSGSLLSGSPPRSAELEPLGGAIPQRDPNIYDDLTVPSGLRQFKFAGDVNRPDFGCEYNGGPVPCNLLSELIRGRDVMIGVRYQGDEGGAWGLRQSISTSIWRYNVRLVVDNEDKRLTAAMYKDKELLKDLPQGKMGLLIGTVYVAYTSPFAELVIEHEASTNQDNHGTLRKGKKGGDFVNDFFDANPNCLSYLQRVLGSKFGDFLKSLRELNFVDTLGNPSLLNKTADELQIPLINDDGTFDRLDGTLGNIENDQDASAVTSPNTHTVYLFAQFAGFSEDHKNAIRIHEGFHDFLRANHTSILQGLAISPADTTISPSWTQTDATGRIIAVHPPVTVTRDQASGIKLTKWLMGNCR